MFINRTVLAAVTAAFGITAIGADAADWSSTSIGLRYGTQYREPFNTSDIKKEILVLTHASGNSLGTNFINVDILKSDRNDPASGPPGTSPGGAHEVFVVYRYTLSLSKATGSPMKFGPIRDVGIQAGFDVNSKNDPFGARVWRPMVGPMLSFDVPGFFDIGVLYQGERNHNGIVGADVHFKDTWRLASAWGIPVSLGIPAKFTGFFNYIGAKGLDGFGAGTKPEFLFETALQWDVGSLFGKKDTFYAGVGYQYWKNKFGSDSTADPTGGSTAKVPQLVLTAFF